MKYLLKEVLIDGSCLTVTRKTIAENLEDVPDLNFEEQDIIYPHENPLKKTVHLQVLYRNLADEGSIAKISGKEREKFEGPVIVFDGGQKTNRRDCFRKSKKKGRGGDGHQKLRSERSIENVVNVKTNIGNFGSWFR